MPGEGAVCPRMVMLSAIFKSDFRAMTPATSKTMILLPDLTASLKEPVPLSLRFVTCTILPPLPPVTNLPWPSAPGKAGACAMVDMLMSEAAMIDNDFFIC